MRPKLSIVVNFYNMRREAPRTLFTLSAPYQSGVDPDDYEVIAVDNGSTAPLDAKMVGQFGPNFSYHYFEADSPSPAAAINFAAGLARGELFGCLIDGARMLSPGILDYSLKATQIFPDPFVLAPSFHLGPEPQTASLRRGYDQAAEDRLLGSVDWRGDGYRLFDISVPAGSTKAGYFGDEFAETNCFVMQRETFEGIGGFDQRYSEPGGGFVNLDFLERVIEETHLVPVILLGEGTFHQFHGGAATGTNRTVELARDFKAEYERIRGRPYPGATKFKSRYLGSMPEGAKKFLLMERQQPSLPIRAVRTAGRGLSGAVHRFRARAARRPDALGRRPSTGGTESAYESDERISRRVATGRHRAAVGGMWDEIGRLQHDFLVAQGLRPEHRLLDVGCGPLGGGVHSIRYLDTGNYWGADLNASLIDASWDRELAAADLQSRQPREQLVCLKDFEFASLGVTFDYAVAVSLFTHMDLNKIRRCVARLGEVMEPGGRLFATYFESEHGAAREQPLEHDPGGIVTFSHKDPFHYSVDDLRNLLEGLPVAVRNHGDWGHPRDQRMLEIEFVGAGSATPEEAG